MIVNDISTLDPAIRGVFQQAYDNGEDPRDITPFITQVDSNRDKEDYAWLGAPPAMREWVGSRVDKSINDYKYEIANRKFEGTLSINRDTIEDDQLGAIAQRARELAFRARTLVRKLFYETLITGETALGYDGVAFFSASHTGTQSNIISSGSGTSLTGLKADINIAESMMMGLKDDQGEPYNEGEMQFGIVCHPALKAQFDELNQSRVIGSSDNPLRGRITQLTYSPRLTDTNDWYFFNVSPGVKGLIHQIRVRPEFESLESNSSQGFDKDIWRYGVRQRENVGFGLWQRVVKVKN